MGVSQLWHLKSIEDPSRFHPDSTFLLRRTEQLLQEERLSSDAAYADLARSARDNDRLREQIAALKAQYDEHIWG